MDQLYAKGDLNTGHGSRAEDSLKIQLDRIETVQGRIRQVVTDESLTELEALVSEFGSRIGTVRALIEQHPAIRTAEDLARLQEILIVQRELERLIEFQLTAMGQRLGNIRSARNINKTYNAAEPKNAGPLLRRDILG
ncbi:hypothetical protein JW859_10300 [bacterium]|nr:hypothetical protein [bacterium]